jgi:hypothetical protein
MTVDEIKNNGIYMGLAILFPKRALSIVLNQLQPDENLLLVSSATSDGRVGGLMVTDKKRLIFAEKPIFGKPFFKAIDYDVITSIKYFNENLLIYVDDECYVFERIYQEIADAFMVHLPAPEAVMSDFDNMMAGFDHAPKTTSPVNPSLNDLEKLAELHAKGILTAEEFVASKKKILGL